MKKQPADRGKEEGDQNAHGHIVQYQPKKAATNARKARGEVGCKNQMAVVHL